MIDLYAWRKADLQRIDREIAEWKREENWQLIKWIREFLNYETMMGVSSYFDEIFAAEQQKLLQRIEKYARIKLNMVNKSGSINDQDIERAREYDISLLFPDARNGVVRCFLHDDKKPSASISKGRFKCWVCNNKPMDAIGVLMERDGKTFKEAVEFLR